MYERKMDVRELRPITVWVTPNVAIFRQLSMWQDLDKRYTFVPTAGKGFVIITDLSASTECNPLKGYTLIRPAGLELSWDADKVVTFQEISVIDALEWSFNTRNTPWKLIGNVPGHSARKFRT